MDFDDAADEPFLKLVPKAGWLHDYMEYTQWSEAPAPFHFFVGCSILGAATGRRRWFSKGHYKVYPNHQIVLIAPTGVCRKTSAMNLGIRLLRSLDINIIADKSTPEALATELSSSGLTPSGQITFTKDAEGVILAPELAVFLGKQKYNEGLIASMTAWFDNPDTWKASTKGGGKTELKNLCLTFQGASTPDWLITAIPQDAFGGGFMSRILFIVQESTPRCFPIPRAMPPPDHLEKYLKQLQESPAQEIKFEKQEAYDWYTMWYVSNKKNIPEDEKMAGYHERKPDHLLRLAIVLSLSRGGTSISTGDLIDASRLLHAVEMDMLRNFKWLGSKPVGVDSERILRILKSEGGTLTSGALMRKVIFYMNVAQYRLTMDTLKAAGLIVEGLDLKTKDVTYSVSYPSKGDK